MPQPLELHPWPPFIPDGARYLIMGTFPPKAARYSIDFYYPNRINDFWRIMGLIFLGDKDALVSDEGRSFKLDEIKNLLTREHIAMADTGHAVRRLRDNASDKFLEIVEPVDLNALLAQMPDCHTIATTGEKAAGVIAAITGTKLPAMGERIDTVFDGRRLTITRMPSTSRAYPLKLERKAEFYRGLFE